MGRREIVGIIVLVVAVVISATFFLVGGSDSGGRPALPVVVDPTPTATPINRNASTPFIAANPLPQPAGGWQVQSLSNVESKEIGVPVRTQRFLVIDFAFVGSPSPDLKDDAWSLDVTGTFTLPPGPYAFVVDHLGPVRIFIDGKEVAAASSFPVAQGIRVDFTSAGASVVRILAPDQGGRFLLTVHDPGPFVPPAATPTPGPTATPKP